MTSNANKDKISHTAEVKDADIAHMDRAAMESGTQTGKDPAVHAPKPKADEVKTPSIVDGGGVYKVVNESTLLNLAKRYDGTDVNVEDSDGESLTYRIKGDALVKDAIDLGVITKVEGGGDVCTLLSAKTLIRFITGIERRDYDDDVMVFHISTTRGEIVIKGDDIFNLGVWKTQAFIKCKMLFAFTLKERGKKSEFEDMLTHVMNNAVDAWSGGQSQSEMMGDIIMEQVKTLNVVENRDDFVNHTALSENGVYYVKSDKLKDVIEGLNYTFAAETQKVLRNHLAAPSTRMAIDKHRVSVWQFIPWGDEQ